METIPTRGHAAESRDKGKDIIIYVPPTFLPCIATYTANRITTSIHGQSIIMVEQGVPANTAYMCGLMGKHSLHVCSDGQAQPTCVP